MRKVLPTIVLSLLFCLGGTALAQSDRWDMALDSYQTICDRCILLRERSLRGDDIPSDELRSLLEQVSSLRVSLQKGSGSMSVAQRERFKRIRDRYSEAFSKAGYSTDGPVLRVARPSLELPRLWEAEKILRASSGSAQNDNHLYHHEGAKRANDLPAGRNGSRPSAGSLGIMFQGTRNPRTLSPGGMRTLCGRSLGFYLKGRSSLTAAPTEDYTCLSDGTSGGAPIWTSGKESHSQWALGAGGIFRVSGVFGLYAGSGYGRERTLWEDAAGKWALVEDYSVRGVTTDAGIIFTISHFQASAGVSAIALKRPSLEIGLGIAF